MDNFSCYFSHHFHSFSGPLPSLPIHKHVSVSVHAHVACLFSVHQQLNNTEQAGAGGNPRRRSFRLDLFVICLPKPLLRCLLAIFSRDWFGGPSLVSEVETNFLSSFRVLRLYLLLSVADALSTCKSEKCTRRVRIQPHDVPAARMNTLTPSWFQWFLCTCTGVKLSAQNPCFDLDERTPSSIIVTQPLNTRRFDCVMGSQLAFVPTRPVMFLPLRYKT